MTDLPRMAWTTPEAFRLHCLCLARDVCHNDPEALIPLAERIQGYLRPPRRKRATKTAAPAASLGNVVPLGRRPA